MSKTCLIYQPCGFGDLMWMQKIAHHFRDQGYEIVWPIVHEYYWLKDYIPWINWVSWNDNDSKLTHLDKLPDSVTFPFKEKYIYTAPCEFTDEFVYINGWLPPQGLVMQFKYESAKIDWLNWQDYVIFNRNKEKENSLFYDILNLKDGQQYCFINRNYQMRPEILHYPYISNDPAVYKMPVVEMGISPDYTLFDWLKVIENAKSIHMIETSLNYIMESPLVRNNFTTDLNLYSRHFNFWQVRGLFNLPWRYMHP